jgi:hypothetical protein
MVDDRQRNCKTGTAAAPPIGVADTTSRRDAKLRGVNDQAIELSRKAARVGANLSSVALYSALWGGAHHEAPTFLKASNGFLRHHEARFLVRLPSTRSQPHGAEADHLL